MTRYNLPCSTNGACTGLSGFDLQIKPGTTQQRLEKFSCKDCKLKPLGLTRLVEAAGNLICTLNLTGFPLSSLSTRNNMVGVDNANDIIYP